MPGDNVPYAVKLDSSMHGTHEYIQRKITKRKHTVGVGNLDWEDDNQVPPHVQHPGPVEQVEEQQVQQHDPYVLGWPGWDEVLDLMEEVDGRPRVNPAAFGEAHPQPLVHAQHDEVGVQAGNGFPGGEKPMAHEMRFDALGWEDDEDEGDGGEHDDAHDATMIFDGEDVIRVFDARVAIDDDDFSAPPNSHYA